MRVPTDALARKMAWPSTQLLGLSHGRRALLGINERTALAHPPLDRPMFLIGRCGGYEGVRNVRDA